MKTNITKIGVALLAFGFCSWSTQAWAQTQTQTQTSTTVTTTRGAFTEYVPGSETVVVKTERDPAPLRYVVTKQTTVVDESGAPVAIERIPPGSQLSVQYAGNGDRLVASRIVVQKPATTVTAPITNGPVTTQEATTTTTTTRPLTHEEKHALHEEREHRKKAAKEEIHRQKEALEKAEDKLDDDDD